MGTLLGILLIVAGGLLGLWIVGVVIAAAAALVWLAVKVAIPLVLIYAGYCLIRGRTAAC